MIAAIYARKSTAETDVKETPAPIPMPPDVRAEVVVLLAQILVADYQLVQGAPRPTAEKTVS